MKQEFANGAYINYTIENKIAIIEFFHPQSNSLPAALLQAMAATIEQAGKDDACKLIILRSSGNKVFCSGASFDELAAITNAADGLQFFSGFANVINAIRCCPKFIIVRVQGKCVGGGVGLAAAADYSIAHESAAIKLSELAVGIGPFVIGPAVERKCGLSAFAEASIDAASWRSTAWALQKELFTEVHTTVEAMDESIKKLSDTLAGYSPAAMQQFKKVLWQGTEHWDTLLKERAAMSGTLILSDYSKNFITKFKKKV